MASLDTQEWRQARQWLISTGVIPPTHRVTKPDVDLVDFARSLRDGVFLCSLLEKLKPGYCSDWNPKPVMQHSFIKNIQTFLHTLTSSFGFEEGDLFADSDLYDVDNFKKVMHTLSRLSQVPEAMSFGWSPFPKLDVNCDYANDEDEIYAQLKDIALSGSTRLYSNIATEEPTKENLYVHGDETIYDCVCYYQRPASYQTQKLPPDCDEKRIHILEELHTTEQNFLQALNVVVENFYSQLQNHITKEEVELLFSTAQALVPVHKALLLAFTERPSSVDISRAFNEQKEGLLLYGSYAAKLPLAVAKAKDLQNRVDLVKVLQTCMEKSCQKFPLSDLLSVPVQRVLKYPLLVKELLKCAKKGSAGSQELSTLESLVSFLEDIAKYINATKGDFEAIKSVKEVEASLSSYTGPSLLQFGRYCLDGELKVKLADQAQPKSKWVFLFEKALLVCKKVNIRLGLEVRYACKHQLMVSNIHVELVNPLNPAHKGKAFKMVVERASVTPLTPQAAHTTASCDEFMCYAKTDELRSQWVDAINHAREVVMPREGKKVAKIKPHKQLVSSQSLGFEPRSPGPKRPNRDSAGPLTTNGSPFSSQIYVAKQRYDAIGSRKNRVLCFEKGEELEVLNPTPLSEWWEAMSLKTGNRGEVPASYLKPAAAFDPMEERLKTFPWYVGKMSRIQAEQALSKMRDGVFLIRESDVRAGEYAIALKWRGMPKHIKIPKHPDSRKFFVSDISEFASIDELVDHYQRTSLGSSFPGVDTTLRYSLKDKEALATSTVGPSAVFPLLPPATPLLLPPPPTPRQTVCSWAEALYPFDAEYEDELTLRKHDEVKIIEKATNKLGWWYGECNGQVGLFPSNYVREET
eukprot:Em0016g1009a